MSTRRKKGTGPKQPRTEEERQRFHEDSLKAFVLRARRVREHSLAKDTATLRRLTQPQWLMSQVAGEETVSVRMELPLEEQLESAAARVRPLLLNDDPTFHAKAMNALLYLANQGGADEQTFRVLRVFKKKWASYDWDSTEARFYRVHVKRGDGPEQWLSDTELGFAWLNGDTLHAYADRHEKTRDFGVVERYRAATPIVAHLVALAVATLGIIEQLRSNGALGFLDDTFEQQVVVEDPNITQEAQVFSNAAQYGTDISVTAMPTLDGELGPEWEPFDAAKEFERPRGETSSSETQ